jgi:hypothetical protein
MKTLFAFILAFSFLTASAQTAKTRAALNTQVDAQLASAQQLTAATLRAVVKDVIASADIHLTDTAYQPLDIDLTSYANAAYSAAAAGTDFVLPGGALGTPTSGTLTNCTFPTLNQSTTGSAATLTTARTINGVSFNGSANITVPAAGSTLTDSVPLTRGGTGHIDHGASLQVLRTNVGATATEWASAGTGDVTAAMFTGLATGVAAVIYGNVKEHEHAASIAKEKAP